MNEETKFVLDRRSFPVNCSELNDLLSLLYEAGFNVVEIDTENPTSVFNQCLQQCEPGVLVIPITRNVYVRDRLRQEGVNLVLCL